MTNSLAFPAMFDVIRNRVGVIENNESIVNRTRLLILTEPTELYNNPNFGVGLKRHLWQYNTENEKAVIKDRMISQFELHEPACVADKTQFVDGLLFTGGDDTSIADIDRLKMTVAIQTVYGDIENVEIK